MEGRTPTPTRSYEPTQSGLKLIDSSHIWDVMRVPATPDDLADRVELQRSKMNPRKPSTPIRGFPAATLQQPLREKTSEYLEREGMDQDVRRKKKNYLDSTTRWPASCYFFSDAEAGFPDYRGYVVRPEGTDELFPFRFDARDQDQSWMVEGPSNPWVN